MFKNSEISGYVDTRWRSWVTCRDVTTTSNIRSGILRYLEKQLKFCLSSRTRNFEGALHHVGSLVQQQQYWQTD